MKENEPKPKCRWRRTVVIALVLFAAIQLISAGNTNPSVATDMISATTASAVEAKLLRAACYDCHSHETHWPWYASVQPVSWWTVRHVREGREHLNFSDWPQTKPWEAKAKLESIAHALRSDSMPLADYRWLHPQSKLTSTERNQLAQWAEVAAKQLSLKPEP